MRILSFAFACLLATAATADDTERGSQGLKLRGTNPAITSARISDFASHPDHEHECFVATASGNLWETENSGVSWTPDRQAN